MKVNVGLLLVGIVFTLGVIVGIYAGPVKVIQSDGTVCAEVK